MVAFLCGDGDKIGHLIVGGLRRIGARINFLVLKDNCNPLWADMSKEGMLSDFYFRYDEGP